MEKLILSRIESIIKDKYENNQALFSRGVSMNPSSIHNMFKKRGNPSYKLLRAIIENNRDINLYWLLLGEGEMLKTDQSKKIKAGNNNNIVIQEGTAAHISGSFNNVAECEREVANLKKEIEYLKKINALLEAKNK